jgi:hypothetical protein
MASQRSYRFRGGDLSEALGVVLLKGIAAVAEVSRPEDVGLDLVATLFRPEGDMLIAEDSFYVQLKSSSERVISYKDRGVAWLQRLKLPFFIGSVDKATSSIKLYGTNALTVQLASRAYTRVRLRIAPKRRSNAKAELRLCSLDLENPVCEWSAGEIGSRELHSMAYETLKPYLQQEQSNLHYREYGCTEALTWETNKPSARVAGSSYRLDVTSPDDLHKVCRSMTHGIQQLIHFARWTKNRDAIEVTAHVITFMRGIGFNPDPQDTCIPYQKDWERLVLGIQKRPSP